MARAGTALAYGPAEIVKDVAFDDALLGMGLYEERAEMVAEFRRDMAAWREEQELEARKAACRAEGGQWAAGGWCYDPDPSGTVAA